MNMMRKTLATAAITGTVLAGGIAPASAAPVFQAGLVNVAVGDVTITDAVDVNVAASAAVVACDLLDVAVNQVAVLSRAIAVDRTGRSQTICRSDAGDVTINNA